MDRADLDPLADILVPSYLETAVYSRAFRDEYGAPPTLFSKVHHMRSIVQAKLTATNRFVLDPKYTEFGRVQVADEEAGRRYLLRSNGAVSVERTKRQGRFFDPGSFLATGVILLVYQFNRAGLDLAVAGTQHEVGRTRLEASGEPSYVGTWPLTLDGESGTFDQGTTDAFEELGNLPVDEDEGTSP